MSWLRRIVEAGARDVLGPPAADDFLADHWALVFHEMADILDSTGFVWACICGVSSSRYYDTEVDAERKAQAHVEEFGGPPPRVELDVRFNTGPLTAARLEQLRRQDAWYGQGVTMAFDGSRSSDEVDAMRRMLHAASVDLLTPERAAALIRDIGTGA